MKKLFYLFVICLCLIGLAFAAEVPTDDPTIEPTIEPTIVPTDEPTDRPTDEPTNEPTDKPLPTNTPTKGPSSDSCNDYIECGTCTHQMHCVWCGEICIDGFFYGSNNASICKDYKWRQCHVDGKIAFIGVLIAIAVFLLMIFICLCKCFCCQSKKKSNSTKLDALKKRAESEKLLNGDYDDEEEEVSSTPVTDSLRARMAEKYGISSNKSKRERQDVV